ncbi:MAG TPA: hypothetical protein VGK54_17975 [Chloroflexota bacterium]
MVRWDPQGVTQPGFRRPARVSNGQRREPDSRSLNLTIEAKQRASLRLKNVEPGDPWKAESAGLRIG